MNSIANVVATKSVQQKKGYLYLLSIWGAALILSLLTYMQPGTHLWPGLDQAWAYGINYAFDKRLVMGRDIYFTFGPLGFLEHTRVVSINMLYLSTIFSFLVSLVMNASLLHLSWQANQEKYSRTLSALVCIGLVVISFPEMQRLLIFGYALLFLHWITRNNIYLILLSCTITFAALIKFSYGAAVLSLWLPYLGVLYYRDRKPYPLFLAVGALMLSYLLVWLAIYGSLSDAFGYLEGEFQISRGNASAMAMNPENNWHAITAFYTALILAAFVLQRDLLRRYSLLPIIFAGPLFVWTKYTFAQEQALHFVPILDFAIFIVLIFLIVVSGWLQKAMLVLLLPCVAFAWKAMHTESVGLPDYDNVPHLTLSLPDRGLLKNPHRHLRYMFNVWRTGEKERLQPLHLPADMKNIIGKASVDIYPWELSIAAANHLNWHPRPAFQTYIAYLPFLDRKNSDFYSDSRAPEYIVWHHHEFQDVMNRYSLSSEPMTTESMLRHYRLLQCEGIFCLWKHVEQDQLQSVNEVNKQNVKWNEWISIPANKELNNTDIIRAKIFAKRTLLGKANLFFWKEGGIEIDYQLKGGVVKTHDLLIDNAVSGVWISPYVDQYLGNMSAYPEEISKKQLQSLLAQPLAQGYIDRIEPTLMGQRLVGWAFDMSADAKIQQQYILLFNSEKSFLLRADNTDRSDVAAYFATQGKKVPNLCGFYEEIADQQLPAGDYKMRFVVRRVGESGAEKWVAIADQGFTLHIDSSMNKNQVSAVRLRTTRPWAFSETIAIQWQELQFAGVVPWK